MNERIRAHDLWTQVCQEDMPELDETYMTMRRTRKFAELIVKECAQILFDESERLIELSSKEANPKLAEAYESCHYQCIDDITLIEKHFGVEE